MPQELWDAAKARQDELTTLYQKQIDGSRAATRAMMAKNGGLNATHRPRTLLSGLVLCGCCGGTYHRALSARLTELETKQDALTARLSDVPHDTPDIHPDIAETYRRRIERLTEALSHPDEALEAMRYAKSSTASSSRPAKAGATTASPCRANSAPS